MEGKDDSIEGTWQLIKFQLGRVVMKLRQAKKLSIVNETILKDPNIHVRLPKDVKTRLVSQSKPQACWYKIDVDGCCISNPGITGTVGVLQNRNGEL